MLSEQRKERNAGVIGSMLKTSREKAGITQKALADTIGLEYYTMISQMELGYISVPPTLWVPLSNALGLDRSLFALRCLSECQPDVYAALFDRRGKTDVASLISAFLKGQTMAGGGGRG